MSTRAPLGVQSDGSFVSLKDRQVVGATRVATGTDFTTSATLPAVAPTAGQVIVFDGAGGSSYGAGMALTSEPFITVTADATLTNERVLTAGNGVTLDTGTPGQIGFAVTDTSGRLEQVVIGPGTTLPYTVPTGAKKARLTVQAAGGGGGSGGGGGGAGGCVVWDVFDPLLVSDITISAATWGAGGTGGTGGGAGTDGTNTTITVNGVSITAYGGGGGQPANYGAGGGTGSAAVGSAQGGAIAAIPFTTGGAFNGQFTTGMGFYLGGACGGGLGGAGGESLRFGVAGGTGTAGGGGASMIARGGAGGAVNGNPGQYGSGGGGGQGGGSGGAGGDGALLIEYITGTS